MVMKYYILKKGMVGKDGERYVTADGLSRAGWPCCVFVTDIETWCQTCGRVQSQNGGGLCVADGCGGTNIGGDCRECLLDGEEWSETYTRLRP